MTIDLEIMTRAAMKPDEGWYETYASELVEGLTDGPNYVLLDDPVVEGNLCLYALRPMVYANEDLSKFIFYGKLSVLAPPGASYEVETFHKAVPSLTPDPDYISNQRISRRLVLAVEVDQSKGELQVLRAIIRPIIATQLIEGVMAKHGKAPRPNTIEVLGAAYESEFDRLTGVMAPTLN